MRDYQRVKKNKYKLPRSVYNRVLWTIRDYNRMKDEINSLVEISAINLSGMPRGGGISDQVSNIVIKRCELTKYIEVIDEAINGVPDEYKDGVWNNIQYNKSYPPYASGRTYARYKAKFIHEVANKLNYI